MNKIITPQQAAKDLADIINKNAETLPKEKREEFLRVVADGLQSSLGQFPLEEKG